MQIAVLKLIYRVIYYNFRHIFVPCKTVGSKAFCKKTCMGRRTQSKTLHDVERGSFDLVRGILQY